MGNEFLVCRPAHGRVIEQVFVTAGGWVFVGVIDQDHFVHGGGAHAPAKIAKAW
jgi:hypothetical protein